MRPFPSDVLSRGTLSALVLILVPISSHAQGYRIGAPRGTLDFSVGAAAIRPNGQLWDFIQTQTTAPDFLLGPTFRAGLRVPLSSTSPFSVTLSVASTEASTNTTARGATVGGQGIEQKTTLRSQPLLLGVSWAPNAGTRVSQLAWVPNSGWRPLIGASLGVSRFVIRQTGEFVDQSIGETFFETFRSSSNGFAGAVDVGVARSLGAHFDWTTTARLDIQQASLRGDFSQFRPMQVYVPSFSTGLSLRF